METITIELRNKKALKLLQELEELNIIKLLPSTFSQNSEKLKPSQLKGFLSHKTANALLKHIENSRNEWEKRFPIK